MNKVMKGACPLCGSTNVVYKSTEVDDVDINTSNFTHTIYCKECHTTYKEYETITYSGCSYEIGGKEVYYNAEGELV